MSFPSLAGDLYVTFEHVEFMSFLIDKRKNLIPVFFSFFFGILDWSKATPLLF